MRRVHRTFFEAPPFRYMRSMRAAECNTEKFYPRHYTYHLGPHCRCPLCGTLRVTRLKVPDKIDRGSPGFLNIWSGCGRRLITAVTAVQFNDRRDVGIEDQDAGLPEKSDYR